MIPAVVWHFIEADQACALRSLEYFGTGPHHLAGSVVRCSELADNHLLPASLLHRLQVLTTEALPVPSRACRYDLSCH
jgi:hypothetical protein